MSKEALAKVVQRAISDAGFRRQLNSDPAGALRGFDLSADELSALRTGNAGRLSTLGVDQRMSKAFVIGGVAAATRMAQTDLSAGDATMIDDASGLGSRTVIPADPTISNSADASGGAAGPSSVRVGDDYKFGDRAATGNAAPVEGSPEADASQIASGGGMANYPPHSGLAGPSQLDSARAGDDWARAGSAARLDDATGGASGGASAIKDDPDGFLAANAKADVTDAYGTAFVDDSKDPAYQSVNDDPDGFLAANANADMSGSVTRSVNDDPDGFLAANANADVSGGTRGDGTAFLDESEAYLTKVGYDANAATSAVTDAHDRGGLGTSAVTDAHDRGDVTRIDDDADSAGTSAASENGPIDH